MSVISATIKEKDLWQSVNFDDYEETPLGLMESQAELLQKKTNGSLLGEVKTYSDNMILFSTFYIIAPKLDYYRYGLLRTATVKPPYPIFIYDYSDVEKADKLMDKKLQELATDTIKISDYDTPIVLPNGTTARLLPPDHVVHNFTDFEKVFANILTNNKTQKIIKSLINQSRVNLLDVEHD
ncbi:MAG: hypothetical protein LBQ66_06415 [Planctomycetaceae bacterium]|jgi:hypothetical protein|nr:hypothetical protein [Planctomycetaceae bacterium]